jgi:membrane peptidoglycan carboxypeptidase
MKQEHIFDGSPVRGCSTISQQTAKNLLHLVYENLAEERDRSLFHGLDREDLG